MGRDLLKTKLSKVIGDGNTIRAWHDRWILQGEVGRPVGPPNENDQDLMVADLLTRGSNDWNVQKVKSLFPLIYKEILSIIPSTLGAEGAFAWSPTKDGVYTTKSGYFIAMKNRATLDNETRPLLELEWTKKVWGTPCLPKIKLFMWKLVQGALALGANLEKRGCGSVPCPRCGEHETAEHLALHCSFAKEVWTATPFHRLFDSSQYQDLKEALIVGMKLQCLPPLELQHLCLFGFAGGYG